MAEPGSGKTLAYLLPAACALAAQGQGGGTTPPSPLVLVLVPTRELAAQVGGVGSRVGKHGGGMRTVVVTGGGLKGNR